MRRALVGLVAATALVTACGGGSSGSSAADLLDASRRAVDTAGTYHLSGSSQVSGQPFRLDIRAKTDGSAAIGTVTIGTSTVSFIKDASHIYVKAPASIYQGLGLSSASLSRLDGHWLRASAGDPTFAQFQNFADIDKILTPAGSVSKGDQTALDGVQVIPLRSNAGTLYVHAGGSPLPVRLQSSQTGGGSLTFDDFGDPVQVTVPTNPIDVDALIQRTPTPISQP